MLQMTSVNPQSVAEQLGFGRESVRFWRNAWLRWGALAVALAGALAWARTGETDATQYITETVTRGSLVLTVSATGTLAPTNEVDVGSELSGIVRTVEVDYNDRVTVGQVLARIDPTKLEAQTAQSRAALEAAQAKLLQTEATLEEARNQLARLEQVREASNGRVPSQQELDAARATLKRADADRASATAAVSQAQATLNANRTDLGKMIIRSPINGLVLKRSVEPGQTVAASFQAPVLFTLAEDLTKMELDVDVDEADIGEVKPGQMATFTVDAYPDHTFAAQVAKVRYGSQTVNGVVTYETVLYVDNSDLLLRPGMTTTADLVVRTVGNALLVPNAALRFAPSIGTEQTSAPSSGGFLSRLMPGPPRRAAVQNQETDTDQNHQRVWVMRGGQPEAVSITPGTTDGRMTEVIGGEIQAGTAVVVDATSQE
jgi:HlyD family secretion protein